MLTRGVISDLSSASSFISTNGVILDLSSVSSFMSTVGIISDLSSVSGLSFVISNFSKTTFNGVVNLKQSTILALAFYSSKTKNDVAHRVFCYALKDVFTKGFATNFFIFLICSPLHVAPNRMRVKLIYLTL